MGKQQPSFFLLKMGLITRLIETFPMFSRTLGSWALAFAVSMLRKDEPCSGRNKMHAKKDGGPITDSMKMFNLGYRFR